MHWGIQTKACFRQFVSNSSHGLKISLLEPLRGAVKKIVRPSRLHAQARFVFNLRRLFVEQELRSGRQNPAENAEERARTLSGTTYPGHYVDDLREHPVAMREARGNRTAFFNMMSTAGHRTHPNVHISELTGPQAYAHKHGNQPMFIILKGAGYDIWSEASDLKAFEAAVKAGTARRAEYRTWEGTFRDCRPRSGNGSP